MKYFKGIPRSYYIFTGFILLFCGLFSVVELINGKLYTNDFKVYFEAVNDFFNGHNPYVKNYGLETGFFKYPPFTLYLFSCFTLIPFGFGQLFHLCLLAFSLIISLPILLEIAQKTFRFELKKKQTWILYLSFFCIAIHLVRELHLGNINLILLLLFTVGLKFIHISNPFKTAIFWGLMVVMKPIMIFAFIPLVFWGKWRLIIYLTILGIFFFLFPALHLGWSGNISIWISWLKSIGQHGEYITSENSLTYLANHYFGIISNWIPSFFCLSILLGIMLFRRFKEGFGKENQKDLLIWSVIFTAFAPNFFVTDTQHFLLAVPMILFLIFFLNKIRKWYYWTLFFTAMLLFSFNSNDLLGRNISDYLDAQGILGIGNLIFLVTFILAGRRFRNNNVLSN